MKPVVIALIIIALYLGCSSPPVDAGSEENQKKQTQSKQSTSKMSPEEKNREQRSGGTPEATWPKSDWGNPFNPHNIYNQSVKNRDSWTSGDPCNINKTLPVCQESTEQH